MGIWGQILLDSELYIFSALLTPAHELVGLLYDVSEHSIRHTRQISRS